ncbi:MAG: NAD(P)H-binding protein [Deltaproteobacteria bacterium]|nr:NAD(P)H-binding protein [Deltaproteobacteria bacterium]
MQPRKIFVAGSTGAIGRTLLALEESRRVPIVAHARPGPRDAALDPRTLVFDLSDSSALDAALLGATTIVQLIGTIRSRFGLGDTYETSDIATTRSLVDGAKRAGCDHFVLLSAVLAGVPIGSYLEAKAKAESIVRESGIPNTIFRPSTFVGDRHKARPLSRAVTTALGLQRLIPIEVTALARAILWSAAERAWAGEILEGASLWSAVERAAGRAETPD